MYSEGCKAVAAGMNPMDLRKGVQMAVEQVIGDLASMSQPTEVRARTPLGWFFLIRDTRVTKR